MEAEFDKLEINKLDNVSTSLNSLKTKVDEKTVPVDLKKLSNAVTKKVMKKTVYNKLNTKVNNLGNKSPGTSTLT